MGRKDNHINGAKMRGRGVHRTRVPCWDTALSRCGESLLLGHLWSLPQSIIFGNFSTSNKVLPLYTAKWAQDDLTRTLRPCSSRPLALWAENPGFISGVRVCAHHVRPGDHRRCWRQTSEKTRGTEEGSRPVLTSSQGGRAAQTALRPSTRLSPASLRPARLLTSRGQADPGPLHPLA